MLRCEGFDLELGHLAFLESWCPWQVSTHLNYCSRSQGEMCVNAIHSVISGLAGEALVMVAPAK